MMETNQVAKQTFSYDQYNNQTDVYAYDFGTGAPGPLIRRTHTDYVTSNNDVDYAANNNFHIRNLPLQQQVFDAGGKKRAETFYEYDLYDNSPNHAPLSDCPNISGHDGAFWAGYLIRGNVTKTSRALLDNNGAVTDWVNSHAQYDIAGNVVKVIDSKGNPTQFDFSDNYGSPDDPEVRSSENPANQAPGELGGQVSYAFPFKITNALGHKAYTKYDYHLGRAALSEDANGVKSNIYFNDALDRPTRGVRAVGTTAASQTVFVYNDGDSPVNGYPARSITTISDKDVFGESDSGDGLKSVALYDSLGRTHRVAAYEGATWSIKDTKFDALGRVSQVSNPYRAADPGSASPPPDLLTTTDYDALSRVIKVTTPDGAHVDTAYSGNQVTVTDQAGKRRRSVTDALGRLDNVIEDPGGLGHVTSYLYDALGNLRQVTQGSQKRWFAYDSLSRLIRAKNPEQDVNANPDMSYADPVTGHNGWSTAYKYDPNGNLTEKTDARNIKTTYGYDALNRNTTVTYSDSTPSITRTYDTATLGKGRLQKTETAGGMGSRVTINDYDEMGRPKSQSQQFFYLGAWGTPYKMQQTYDLAGDVKTMTYPSDRTVNYSYDSAGRLSSFTGNLGDGQLRTYSTITQYHPAGMIERETFGTQTPLHHKKRYNNRLQLGDIQLSAASDELRYDRGALLFFYGPNAVASADPFANDPTNNGNLVKQAHYVPIAGGGEVVPQSDSYTYDELNRISGVVEPNVFTQTYGYDPFGNRRITGATGGVNNYNPTYDTGSNRIVGPGYDPAGNIISDLLTGGTMTYDAENRLLTASAGGGGTYTYDADGRRTRRTAEGQETWHIYGVVGELLAEYAADGAPSAPKKEYGYRGGQILIIAEIGSGGGTSFVKPASQSRSDLIGKIGAGASGTTNRTSSADEPFINNSCGSITADPSDIDNTGTLVRGGPRTTAEEYGDAPFANGIGGELLAEHPAGDAPGAPQEGYRNRSGLSIVTAQSNGVVTVNPTAFQTPDSGQGGAGVSSQINTGHGSTITGSSVFAPGGFGSRSDSDASSAIWSGFQSVSGAIVSIRLKFDWSVSGSASAGASDDGGSASSSCVFNIDYSLNGGSGWTNRVTRSLTVTGNDDQNLDASGSEDILLSPSQNITQVQVRDFMRTSAAARGGEALSSSAVASNTTSISRIRLEIDTAPVISNVAAGSITTTTATITWTTDESSDSQVEYGPTTAYEHSTTLNPALVTAHSQGLSGLTPGTPYHYRVKSRDATGNLTMSGDFTFTTATPPDTTPPVISNVAAVGVTTTTATITWTTNENSDSQVEYGPTTAYEHSTTLNPAPVTAHSQSLSGLTAGTVYHYHVKSKDAAGNLAVSGDFTFTTAQIGSAAIKWLVTDHLGSTRMVIDETGNLAGIKRRDFAPFGEELSAGVGIRSASLGYSSDSVRQKFAGYEHDGETGLDFAQARYYANIQGRFTSADPFYINRIKLGDPQQLNLYSYVRNNPLSLTDPTGMVINTKRLEGDDLRKWKEIVDLANATDENGNLLNPKLHELYNKLQDDDRTFYIQGGELGHGTAGKFEVELTKGNDFVSASITLDFKQIKKAEVTDATHGGFKQFEGLRNEFERFAEVAGHEFQHAADAIEDPNTAVFLHKQITGVKTLLLHKKEIGDIPPFEYKLLLDMRTRTSDAFLIPSEKSAYSAEKTILQELRAKYEGKKGK